jgi:hypothetical protein
MQKAKCKPRKCSKNALFAFGILNFAFRLSSFSATC